MVTLAAVLDPWANWFVDEFNTAIDSRIRFRELNFHGVLYLLAGHEPEEARAWVMEGAE